MVRTEGDHLSFGYDDLFGKRVSPKHVKLRQLVQAQVVALDVAGSRYTFEEEEVQDRQLIRRAGYAWGLYLRAEERFHGTRAFIQQVDPKVLDQVLAKLPENIREEVEALALA